MLSHCTDYKQIKKSPAVVQTADDEKVLEFDHPKHLYFTTNGGIVNDRKRKKENVR